MRAISIAVAFLLSAPAFAQDELMNILNENAEEVNEKVTATFKSTRLINGHTIETRTQGVLDFLIGHRFGPVNSGVDNFWGIDGATIRLGLEYGITDKLNVGVGRSSFRQIYDFFGKYKAIGQDDKIPVTVTLFASAANLSDNAFKNSVGDAFERKFRWAYTYQAMIAHKMGGRLSLQVTPTLIHRNYVATLEEPNDLLAIGVGGRFKVTNRVTINLEYFPTLNMDSDLYHDVMAVGVDIETGGHVFQLHLTNSQHMVERGFIGETQGNFLDGDIHFGFNISRVFNLSVKQEGI